MASRRVRTRRITVSYEIMTPESAEAGDVEERGWLNEEGVDMEPDDSDIEDGITAVDKAVKFLRYEGATEHSGGRSGGWFSWPDWSVQNYRTGEERMQSYFPEGFSKDEVDEIIEQMKRRR